ncbi:hypothetical protein BDQ12DRAFT_266845 [Crucibulum laeve]|uniref:Transcription regulator Rua1 C-terminal domain-containing protein n=1 Tax=Crucibulum laeve TaxID=68775 RepID=A0A5C3M455_9AGAR|nr:hypothetical protein BDQ12DRAFT_266845 [Crucibulum laeve]
MDSAPQNHDATSQRPAHFSLIHQDSSPLRFYQLEVPGLHYAYPLQDAVDDFTGTQNDVNSLSSQLIKPSDRFLLASPFSLSSTNRSESVDSNATLINTPPKIFRFPDTEVSMFQPAPASSPCIGAFHFSPSSSDSSKSRKSVYYTPLGEAFHDQFNWILSQSDESPVIRSQEPLSQAVDVDECLDFPAFGSLLDKFRAIPPSSQPTTPVRRTLTGPLSLSPLTPLSCSPSLIPTRKRKRDFSESSVSNLRKKRCRFDLSFKNKENIPPPLASITTATTTNARNPSIYSQRTLPKSAEICTDYALFYRRFPVSSFFQPPNEKSPCTLFQVRHPGGTYNPPRGPLDLYTPRFVKGISLSKVGLCPICVEPVARGGENNKLWLSTKFSAFK